VTVPGAASHPVCLGREAFALTFRGSRRDLEEVTAWRMQAALVFLVLATRCVHLAQAGIDLAAGSGAYSRPDVAVGLAVACGAESALFAVLAIRAGRLTFGVLLGDAAFGVAGLAAMSAATTTMTADRAGSLNWMLPYTVTTVVALGVLLFGDAEPVAGRAARAGRISWWLWRRMLARTAVAGGLATAYIAAMNLPRRLPPRWLHVLWFNDANYAAFFLAASVVGLLLRRWLMVIRRRNAETVHQAARLSHEARWRAMTVDVFGPVLELLDDLAVIGEQVPVPLQVEAGRLIGLIEAVNPLAGRPMPSCPDAEAAGPGG
jgi:hypothetical protein